MYITHPHSLFGVNIMKKINFKINKYFYLAIIIMLIIIFLSFFNYAKGHFNGILEHNKIIENCDTIETDYYYCKWFYNNEALETYKQKDINRGLENYLKMDAITLFSEIIQHELFSMLQFISPLIIMIAIVGVIHKEINTGYIKNILLRNKYKDYIVSIIKKCCKVALIIPLSILFVFVISCLITRFNFNVNDFVKMTAVYDQFKYNNFFLYIITIMLVQFLVSFVYSILGVVSALKNKNTLVAILLGYIYFLLLVVIIYLGVYVIFVNKLLGFTNLTEYFSITGYWFFDGNINLFAIIIISFILFILSLIFLYFKVKDKEKVIINVEKQNS